MQKGWVKGVMTLGILGGHPIKEWNKKFSFWNFKLSLTLLYKHLAVPQAGVNMDLCFDNWDRSSPHFHTWVLGVYKQGVSPLIVLQIIQDIKKQENLAILYKSVIDL